MGKEHEVCFDCSYCRARNKNNVKEYFTPPSDINPLFTNIPVVINVFYGDPLLYLLDTIKCLSILKEAKHQGPVIIITKGDMSDPKIKEVFDKDWGLKIYFGLSVFGNDEFDNVGTLDRLRSNLKVCQELSQKYTYAYGIEYRPIINGINDSDDIMKKIFLLASYHYTGIAYSGLQVEPELAEYIKENNLPFTPYEGFEFGMKKNISDEVIEKLKYYSKMYRVPIFKKTSCSISYLLNIGRDYNSHYYRPNEMVCADCPNNLNCVRLKEEFNDEVGFLKTGQISKLPFDLQFVYKEKHECRLHREGLCKFPSDDCMNIKGVLLTTDRKLTTSDVRVIKWLTGFTVDADFEESPYISEDWLVNNNSTKEESND
jgi:hypothetical protein